MTSVESGRRKINGEDKSRAVLEPTVTGEHSIPGVIWKKKREEVGDE
jgi:hypothetical protein